MQNKLFFTIIFLGISASVFAESAMSARAQADYFVNNFYWYQKYLPQENIADLYTLHNAFLFLKETNANEFERFASAVSGRIQVLDAETFKSLQREVGMKKDKLAVLQTR